MTIAIILFSIIFITTIGSHYGVKWGLVHFVFAKKILHIVAISISAVSVFLIDNTILMYVVGGVLPFIFLLVWFGYFKSDDGHGWKNWGVFYFAFVFFVLLVMFPEQPQLVFYPLIVLALADGLATIIGFFLGRHTFSSAPESKSWEGSAAFFLASFFCFYALPILFSSIDPMFESFSALLIVALFLTALEAISTKGRDNIWIPLLVVYWIFIDTSFITGYHVLVVGGLGALAYLTYKMRWLTNSGAIATALLGCVLIISREPEWIIPATLFFVVGSLISFLPQKGGMRPQEARNSFQVFYNGGISTFFIVLYYVTSDFGYLVGGLAALSVSMGDTMSSELGTRYGKQTFDILTFRRVQPGLSGGISLAGTLFGFVSSALFSFIPFLILGNFNFGVYVVLLIPGVFGNLLDSYLGALFQIKYQTSRSLEWSDYPTESAPQVTRGYSFISNDIVNLISTIAASILGVLLYNLL